MNFRKTASIAAWLLLASFATVQTASADRPEITDTQIRTVFVDVDAETLSINGINFGDAPGVALLSASDGLFYRVDIIDWADTTITAELPSTSPGNYNVAVLRSPINRNNLVDGR